MEPYTNSQVKNSLNGLVSVYICNGLSLSPYTAPDKVETQSVPSSLLILFCLFPVLEFFYRTILLSVISLLNEPNTSSAANVDASVLYRKWRDSRGKDKQYIDLITYVLT